MFTFSLENIGQIKPGYHKFPHKLFTKVKIERASQLASS